MSHQNAWGPNIEFVDGELEEYLRHDSSGPKRVSVMIRPADDRDDTIELIEEAGGRDVEPLATESISADISATELESLMRSSAFEAVELVRPLRTFDSGN
ncbi:hypothetical protein [Halosimplex amylolyticum]|uniref:hypothetical protein n=1 Tax=Halosimplex amylolyticum TaxID=3396616 RepID=UPI003F554DFB